MCVVCFLMFSKILFQETKVLSAGFPKEYDHINLAAKHPKLCTYFISKLCLVVICDCSIHPYIHICMHAHMHID